MKKNSSYEMNASHIYIAKALDVNINIKNYKILKKQQQKN
jgi:hypothetical protein